MLCLEADSLASLARSCSQLNKQIESGTLKLIDEKKSLTEISLLRRTLTSLTKLTTLEESIAQDRVQVDELRKALDDPESKRVQARWDELKSEMEGLREEGRKAWDERNGLFEKRNELQKQMVSWASGLVVRCHLLIRDAGRPLCQEKGRQPKAPGRPRRVGHVSFALLLTLTLATPVRSYYAKVREDQKAKQDRFRAEKAAQESLKRDEEIARLREEARIPAFSREIEDCGVLIGWFNGRYGNKVPEMKSVPSGAAEDEARALTGVKELNLRKVEDEPVGVVLDKKAADAEDPWASLAGTGGKKGKKGKKTAAPAASTDAPAPTSTSNASVNLPYALLTAILNLSIPPPSSQADVARCVSDLEHKKAWFEANQKQKTEQEIVRVEAVVKRMSKKGEKNGAVDDDAVAGTDEEEVKPEVNGQKEPFHSRSHRGVVWGVADPLPAASNAENAVEQGEQVRLFLDVLHRRY